MANLQNLRIDQTYDGLIKTNDENAVDATLKGLQDGAGNNLPIEVSTSGVNFTGTVTGIDTGVQSVVAGTNVTVDNTDPANPIVSAAGGGGGITGVSNTVIQTYAGPSTSDTIYYELLVPGGTFTTGDIVRFSALAKGDFTGGGWIYDAAWINSTAGNFPGQYPLGGHASTDQMSITWNKTFYIHSGNGEGPAGGTTIYHDGSPIEQQSNGTAQYMDQYRIPVNWDNNQYISFSAYVDNTGSSINLAGVALTKINA